MGFWGYQKCCFLSWTCLTGFPPSVSLAKPIKKINIRIYFIYIFIVSGALPHPMLTTGLQVPDLTPINKPKGRPDNRGTDDGGPRDCYPRIHRITHHISLLTHSISGARVWTCVQRTPNTRNFWSPIFLFLFNKSIIASVDGLFFGYTWCFISFLPSIKTTLEIGKKHRLERFQAALLKRSWSGNMSCWSSLHPAISRRRGTWKKPRGTLRLERARYFFSGFSWIS